MPTEESALNARLAKARLSADATGSRESLDRFEAAASDSEAVMAMHLMPLAALIEAPGGMVSTFYGMVASGSRLSNDEHDIMRGTLDNAINPKKVYEHIRFAALSLNRQGLKWFGKVFVTLSEDAIAARASVFEENPLTFFDNKKLRADKPIPPGYRAPWEKRGDLAVAKLHAKIRAETCDEEFPYILMDQGSSSDRADYIEVHIYGPLMPKAFREVKTLKPGLGDAAVWKRAKRKLIELGVQTSEQ